MNKYAICICVMCAAFCACPVIFAEEEPTDELSAIDRELETEQRPLATTSDAIRGEQRAKPVPVIKPQEMVEEQQAVEQRGSSWVKRDMNAICGEIGVLSSSEKKGKPFQFDRDDLDLSRTGKPDHIPRDIYNDNP